MNHPERPAASASDIAAARLLLQKMGIAPADLLQDPAGQPEIPTFADYIPQVSQAVSDGTRRVYSTYWNRVVKVWGPRLITSVTPLEISQIAEDIKTNVTPRRNVLRGVQDADETGAEHADDRRRDRPAGLARRGDLVGEVPSVVGEVPGVSRRPR
jgi:hypothetical protein